MKPELLSPAGSYNAALAAFQYGADAIYLGMPQFSARAEAENISTEELAQICAYARTFTPAKKIYITLNTLLYDNELESAFETLSELEEFQPDGVIVQDIGAIRMIKKYFPSLPLHASTQMVAHNLDSVLALKDLGFERVVLARELSLSEIENIVEKSGVEIEIFIHGALCYSYSGVCLFSKQTTGRSGNRGRCAYCCRHPFTVENREEHPFSMKDMALLPMLDSVVATGAHSLKIEGRMKSPLYVACVTDAYRRKLDGNLPPEEEKYAIEEIQTIFSRPWTNFYMDSVNQSPESIIDSATVGHRGAVIGSVAAVIRDDDGNKRLCFRTSRDLEKFDGLQIDILGSARPFGFSIRNMRCHGEKRDRLTIQAGSDVEVEISADKPPRIDRGAMVYCSSSQNVQNHYKVSTIRASELNIGIGIDVTAEIQSDRLNLKAIAPATGDVAEYSEQLELEPANNPERTAEAARNACSKLGETSWTLNRFSLSDPNSRYVPPAIFNRMRRELVSKLDICRQERKQQKLSDFAKECSSHCPPQNKPPQFTLKTRISAPLPADAPDFEYSRVVVELDFSKPSEILESMAEIRESLHNSEELLVATPLITRAENREVLQASIALLVESGYVQWEVADLSGYRLLKEAGITPCSADWSLYALNREASCALREFGFVRHVTSPEMALNHIYRQDNETCTPEYLIYQHTPLYISANAPLIDQTTATSGCKIRGGKRMNGTVNKRGSEWVTLPENPVDRTSQVEDALSKGDQPLPSRYFMEPIAIRVTLKTDMNHEERSAA